MSIDRTPEQREDPSVPEQAIRELRAAAAEAGIEIQELDPSFLLQTRSGPLSTLLADREATPEEREALDQLRRVGNGLGMDERDLAHSVRTEMRRKAKLLPAVATVTSDIQR